MSIVWYKGNQIAYTEYIPARNEYALFNIDEDLVAVISLEEYYDNPELSYIGNSNGRYRTASASICSSAFGKPSCSIPYGTVIRSTTLQVPGSYVSIIFASGDTVPSEPPEDAGIRAGEVVGERCWWCAGERLYSVYMTSFEWFPGTAMTGNVSEGVGVHAFKSTDQLIEYGSEVLKYIGLQSNYPFAFDPREAYLLAGKVAMWGEIMEHERGYRAEYAKITSLDTRDLRIRKRYGV